MFNLHQLCVCEDISHVPHYQSLPKKTCNLAMTWDFREAVLPPGVEVVNGEAEFILQPDGSTALFLPPMAYLKLSFTTGQELHHSTGLGGQLINDYTLTMDILLDTLPSESMSLFQCDGMIFSEIRMLSFLTCMCILF